MDIQITLLLPASLHAQAEDLARRLGLTRSALLAEALADFLDLHGDACGEPGEDDGDPA